MSQLHLEVEYNNKDKITSLIEEGADLNEFNRFNQTPLMVACRYNPDAARILIDKGVDLNLGDEFSGTTPLHIAAEYHPEIAKLLIDKGALVNPKKGVESSFHKETILHVACRHNSELAILFIKKGALTYTADRYKKSPLEVACQYQPKAAEHLISINKKEEYFYSLLVACEHQPKIAELLLSKNTEETYFPHLLVACKHQPELAKKIIVEHNIDVNQLDEFGNSLLHLSCTDHPELTGWLIEKGVKTDVLNVLNQYASDVALESENFKIAAIIQKDHFEAEDVFGKTSLIKACEDENENYISALINEGADIHCKNRKGQSALDVLEAKPILSTELKTLKEKFLLENEIKSAYDEPTFNL